MNWRTVLEVLKWRVKEGRLKRQPSHWKVCMPFKNDLSLIPSTFVKKAGQDMCTYIPSTGELEPGGSLGLAGQWDTLSPKTRCGSVEKDSRNWPLASHALTLTTVHAQSTDTDMCTYVHTQKKTVKAKKEGSLPIQQDYHIKKKKNCYFFSPNRTQWELREGRSLATAVPCSWIVRLNMVLLLHLVSKFKRKNSNQTKANQNTSKTNNTNTSKALFTVIRIWSSSLAWIV